jgi:hypothetical protein
LREEKDYHKLMSGIMLYIYSAKDLKTNGEPVTISDKEYEILKNLIIKDLPYLDPSSFCRYILVLSKLKALNYEILSDIDILFE